VAVAFQGAPSLAAPSAPPSYAQCPGTTLLMNAPAGHATRRCAAPDFSQAHIVHAGPFANGSVTSGRLAYAGVDYIVPLSEEQDMCSGRMTSSLSWAPSGPVLAPGAPTWSGGSGGGGRACDASSTDDNRLGLFCAPFRNPNRGMTSFDNILWAWIAIFQIITQVGRGC
jgi:hypothetical protein